MDFRVHHVVDGLGWGEGPVFVPRLGRVLFTDIPNNRILAWREGGTVEVFDQDSNCANGLTIDAAGHVLACEHRTRRVVRFEKNGQKTVLADAFAGRPLNSPNDVIAAPDGSIWFTDPDYGIRQGHCSEGSRVEQPVEGVYRVDPASRDVQLMIDCLDKPNGLCLSPDGQVLFVSDTGYSERPDGNHHIFRFDMRASMLRPARVFATVTPGGPDGMRLDADGLLWSTSGDGLQAFDPSGKLIASLPLGEMTTNLCEIPSRDQERRFFVTTPARALFLELDAADLVRGTS